MIRILLAEDHLVLRAALRALLDAEPDLEVVGEVGDMGAALGLASELRPDVIVLEIGLLARQGFDALRRLSRALATTRVLLLTDFQDPGLVRDAVVAGASGCVTSQEAGSALAAAVHTVACGNLYIQPGTVRALLTDLLAQPTGPADGTVPLTPRELEVLRLVASGSTNGQVATELDVSLQTVERDRETIMLKLGLRSRADLVRYAALRWLVETLA